MTGQMRFRKFISAIRELEPAICPTTLHTSEPIKSVTFFRPPKDAGIDVDDSKDNVRDSIVMLMIMAMTIMMIILGNFAPKPKDCDSIDWGSVRGDHYNRNHKKLRTVHTSYMPSPDEHTRMSGTLS
ncbi:hypothetical protein K490DRAFT_56813 [Saccharata proteae CBS 121410]|uniref:Uncharacterized protein n=1 Tax=Saccharata proteae CBS 121410 TaxID=1314787 RepID=A0A9P4HVT0_9PEZI|nr:hypothetical protein K490DRAFT_56813 [Saccharata proteae CBS 121410]